MPQAAKEEITLSRIFDVPPELVYRAFVDPDQLCLWFGRLAFPSPARACRSTRGLAGSSGSRW